LKWLILLKLHQVNEPQHFRFPYSKLNSRHCQQCSFEDICYYFPGPFFPAAVSILRQWWPCGPLGRFANKKVKKKPKKTTDFHAVWTTSNKTFGAVFSGGRGLCKTSKTDSTAFDFFSISGRLSGDNRPRELCIFVI